MNRKIAVIGGDLRIINLAEMFTKDGNLVYMFGHDKYFKEKTNTSLEETIKNAEVVVSSIPFSKDGINIYTPFSENEISINNLASKLTNKTFFAGNIPETFYEQTQNTKIMDLMKQEDLTILNTIATAEGTISDIILNMPKNIRINLIA